ncbi:MAG: hypothetical protein JNK82_19620 [Myxococcaceae bacterium]|nr:hypothetical protein [Myxococcaceae bacterium]
MRKLKVIAALVAVRLVGCSACATADDSSSRFEHVMGELKATTPGDGLIAAEWYLVSLSMAGIAAKNLGRADELRWLTRRALDADVRAFDTRAWKSDALQTLDGGDGHAGYLGHAGLLLALECSAENAVLRRRVLGALERRYGEAPDALLETYPNQKWVPDNAVTLAAVAEGARCDGREVPARAWLARWPRDAKSGVLKFTPRSGARASGAGWNSYYLPFVDAAAARAQFEAAERVFLFDAVPGLAAWREYPPGVKGSGDVDSGPLVFGLSPSGTGFAIAGATLYGSKSRGGMLRTAEAAGITVPWRGLHYLLSPLVGQAAVLAAKTLH